MALPQAGLGAGPTPDVAPLRDIIPGLSHLVGESPDERLAGSVCGVCGTACFPRREVCLNCGSRDMHDKALGPAGKLYSFSTVHVSSARPVPYTIGYVDLDEGVRLLAAIVGDDLVLDGSVRLMRTEDGFAFTPTTAEMAA